jgi:CRISPR system Cascade subunit CasE
MHSTLSRAFAASVSDRPERYLWRLETPRNGALPFVLVQSKAQGNWPKLLAEVPGWCAPPETRSWDPSDVLVQGMSVQFRLRANTSVSRQGKRIGLWREAEQRDWFIRQLQRAGLTELCFSSVVSERLLGNRRRGEGKVVVCAAQADGSALVSSTATLTAAVGDGLGHAKMMGLGLLSIARARS